MKKTVFNKFVSLTLSVIIVLSVFISVPFVVNATENVKWVSTEKMLKEYASAKNVTYTVKLANDINTGSSVHIYGNITLDLNGHKIDRGMKTSKNNGEVIQVEEKAKLTVRDTSAGQNGMITGGYSFNGGGGVHVKKGMLILESGKISGNKSEEGGGGVYLASDDSSQFLMTGGELSDNHAKSWATSHNGGAIYIDYGAATIKGGTIANNSATGYGGAVYQTRGTGYSHFLTITGGEFINNSAKKDGGAIYLNKGKSAISNATFDGNSASGNGGAIYYNAESAYFADSTFKNNSAAEGGAIYINNTRARFGSLDIQENTSTDGAVYINGYNVACSGKLIIKNNKKSGSYDDTQDLRLKGSGTLEITSDLDSESAINLYKISGKAGNEIVKDDNNRAAYNEKYFNVTNSGLRAQAKTKNIVLVKSSDYVEPETEPATEPTTAPTPTEEETTTKKVYSITVDGKEYPVYSTEFYTPAHVDVSTDLKETAYYSDGYFMQDAHTYNEHLASMSMSLSMAAFNSNYGEWDTRSRNIKQLYTNLEFNDIETNSDYDIQPTRDTVGIAMANRELPDGTILVPIALRGTNYDAEWASNVTVGTSGEAQGFLDAANKTMTMIENYIADHNLDSSKIKFWVTGYSRTGAVSNLVAKKLVDKYNTSGERVYAYCIAPANGGTESELIQGNDYTGIHNIVNATDIVPWVATYEMGFIRYGTDHYVPGDPQASTITYETHNTSKNMAANPRYAYDNSDYIVDSTEYKEQVQKMLDQLATIGDKVSFDDEFHWASFDYLPITHSSLTPYETSFSKFSGNYQKDFLPYLLGVVQNKIMKNPNNTSMSVREYYAANTEIFVDKNGNSDTYNDVTLQEALAQLMEVWRTDTTKEQQSIIADKAKNLKGIIDGLSDKTDIYKNLIRNYENHDMGSKEGYANAFLNLLNTNLLQNDEIGLSDAATTKIKNAWPVLFDFLLNLAHYDECNGDKANIILGTLMYNASRIGQAHIPVVNYAWIRSYDSFYEKDVADVDISQPVANLAEGEYTEDQVLTITHDADTVLYYTTDGSNPVTSDTRIKYDGQINLITEQGTIKTYVILACAEKTIGEKTYHSEMISLSYSIVKASPKYLLTYDDTTYAYEVGSEVELSYEEGELLANWVIKNNDGDDVTSEILDDATQSTIKFKMPAYDIEVFVNLKETYLYGDVDMDGRITIRDASLVQKYLADFAQLNEDQVTLAELSYDDRVSVKDAALIQEYVAGMAKDNKTGTPSKIVVR